MINILSFNKKRCKELTLIQSKVTIRECWQQQLSKIAARLPPGLQLGAGPSEVLCPHNTSKGSLKTIFFVTNITS